jgi:hypothetical protein
MLKAVLINTLRGWTCDQLQRKDWLRAAAVHIDSEGERELKSRAKSSKSRQGSMGDGSSSEEEYVEGEQRRRATNAIVLFAFTYEAAMSSRASAINRHRLDWSRRVHQLEAEGFFDRTYRMSVQSYNILLSHLRADMAVDVIRSTASTGVAPIEPENVFHCLLHWLAGGSYLVIRDSAELSVSSFYRVLHVGLRAVLRCEFL